MTSLWRTVTAAIASMAIACAATAQAPESGLTSDLTVGELPQLEGEADAEALFDFALTLIANDPSSQSDVRKAFDLLHQAAFSGYADAQHYLGDAYIVAENPSMAENFYLAAAAQEHTQAQFALGFLYSNQESPLANDAEAVNWYRRAAKKGVASAQFNLGKLYYDGRGVPENYFQAMEWCQRAAVQGDARAQLKIGLMYALGQGVPEDNIKAYMWTSISAALGYNLAVEAKPIIAKNMSRAQIQQAQQLSAKCFESNYQDCD